MTTAVPCWLDHLQALAVALETGAPLPERPDAWGAIGEQRPTLTLIRGGLDEKGGV